MQLSVITSDLCVFKPLIIFLEVKKAGYKFIYTDGQKKRYKI